MDRKGNKNKRSFVRIEFDKIIQKDNLGHGWNTAPYLSYLKHVSKHIIRVVFG